MRPAYWHDLTRPLRPTRRDVARWTLLAFALSVQVALGLGQSWCIKHVFDVVIPGASLAYLGQVALLMLALQVAWLAVQRANHRLEAGTAVVMSARLRERVFASLQRQPEAYFDREPGFSTERIVADLFALEDLLTRTAPRTLLNLLIVAMSFGYLLWLDPRLAGVIAAALTLSVLPPLVLGRRAAAATARHVGAREAVAVRLREAFELRDVTRELDLQAWQQARFGQVSQQQDQAYSDEHLSAAAVVAVSMSAGAAVPVALVLAGGWLMMTSGLALGALISAFTVVGFIQVSLAGLARSLPVLMRADGAIRRLQAFTRHPDPGPAPPPLPPLADGLRLEGVRFAYGGPAGVPVLEGVDLTLPAGCTTAIVGPSGSGKSTLLRLLQGGLVPDAGRLQWDDVDLAGVGPARRAERLGVVAQQTLLFDLDVRENIRLGRLDADDADIERAARAAGLPLELLGRAVGPRGARLSGGQRQRVAIARVVLRAPDLLLLDEPTAALDPVAEAAVERALAELARGRTTVLVTHRLQQARLADRIVVIEHGAVVEQGDHDALLAADGLYARLWRKQSRATLSADGASASIDAGGLRTLPLFEDLDRDAAAALAGRFSTVHATPGQVLCEAGDRGHHFYLIVRGRLDVLGKGDAPLGELAEGDWFGELALLGDTPRNATVRTREPAVLLMLSRDDFASLLERAPAVRARILEVARQRGAGR